MRYALRVMLATSGVLLASCAPKPVKPASPSAPISRSDTAGAIHYRVDGAASELAILVYRGGAMARLGHNHVVSSKEVSGDLYLHRDVARSQIQLTLPVQTLMVDDPTARARAGAEFAAEVPQDAREGTRRNLLREEVLDGERYPRITLQSVKIAGERANPTLTMRIQIKDAARDVPVSASVRESGSRLTASGEFTLKQTDFGIKPFSVALGALQVQDELRVKFSLVCVQQQ